jgi:hypothetical protein
MDYRQQGSPKLCVVCGQLAHVDVYQGFSRLEPGGTAFRHEPGDELGHRYYCNRHVPPIFAEALERRSSRAA